MPRLSTDAPKPSCPNPICGSQRHHVIRSTGELTEESIRRRRECLDCGWRWSTDETIDKDSITPRTAIDSTTPDG